MPHAEPAAAVESSYGDLIFFNGLGGFTPDGREYVVTIAPGQVTPAPWVNVLANPSFGTIVSESGCANTWSENAHEFLLTPWSNDPVSDSGGEAFYFSLTVARALVAETRAGIESLFENVENVVPQNIMISLDRSISK